RPWILITLGTTFNQDVAFFHMAARAAEEMGALPILALGADLDTEWVQRVLAGVPARTVCRAWLDFGAVLPYTAVAIHHGGAGTTHAFITHAIPQIVVPHAADQMRQAHGVARTQIGVGLLPQNTSTAALVQILAQLLPGRAPARGRAIALQREFAALGGPPAAAKQIACVVI
ncbi:MAG: nucleotide disphospho-sugar-binding domain-containing protein, partial [Litorilinea sp.]